MIKWLIEYYTHNLSSKLSSNKREYIEIILTYTLKYTLILSIVKYDKDHARAYKRNSGL